MLIVAAGMPRSGSTWLYNAVRLMSAGSPGGPLVCGWVDDIGHRIGEESCLVKVHSYDAAMADRADLIFYSYRDVRDSLASQERSFGRPPTIEDARYFIENDANWRACATHAMRYESFIEDQSAELARIAAALGLDAGATDLAEVKRELDALSRGSGESQEDGYDKTNLFHKGHVTDGRHGSWRGALPEELVGELEREFAGWFRANGYDLG